MLERAEEKVKELEKTNQFLIDALNDLCHKAGEALRGEG
jgi:hypothetical protein